MRKITTLLIMFLLLFSFTYVYADFDNKEDDGENTYEETLTINDIIDTWKDLSDEELTNIIGNSEDIDVANFLNDLSEDDLKEILSRKTMLLNIITSYKAKEDSEDEVYTEQEIESEQIYWEYLLSLVKKKPGGMLKASAPVASTKTGYCYIQIEGNGVKTRRKIQVTLQTTSVNDQQTATFKEVAVDGYSDNHSFTIKTASSKTQYAWQDGSRKYYEIVVLQLSYKKPAHYKATASYPNKVDGYRMNFRKYTYDNEGENTINNTGHNESAVTETLDFQTNIMNCGMMKDDDGNVTHATAKITLDLYYGALKVNPNGGTWSSSTETQVFSAQCTKTKSISNPTRTGYTFTGWTVSQGTYAHGSINRNTSGSTINSAGCTFTYGGTSSAATTTANNQMTTLKANWSVNSYTVTCIDVIGTNSSGTRLRSKYIFCKLWYNSIWIGKGKRYDCRKILYRLLLYWMF